MPGIHCDGHDAPAVREIHWIEHPRTADERGGAIAICGDQLCEDQALAELVMAGGELVEITPAA